MTVHNLKKLHDILLHEDFTVAFQAFTIIQTTLHSSQKKFCRQNSFIRQLHQNISMDEKQMKSLCGTHEKAWKSWRAEILSEISLNELQIWPQLKRANKTNNNKILFPFSTFLLRYLSSRWENVRHNENNDNGGHTAERVQNNETMGN